MKHFSGLFLVLLMVLLVFLPGCGFSPQRSAPVAATEKTPFVAPTVPPTPVPTKAQPTPVRPTQKTNCTNVLSYIRDVTIPDGTEIAPGASLDKRWEVENSGTCNWDETYTLKLTTEVPLGSPKVQLLYPARSGTRLEIRILLKAPMEAGNYKSVWQAYDPSGKAFGDPITIDIVVK
jgi:hypothetical protein